MIERVIDKVSAFGDWIGKDMRRVHVLMGIADLIGLAVAWVLISNIFSALSAPETQAELVTILRGKSRWALIGLCIPFGHLALTPLGQRWIRHFAASYSVTFIILAVGGALSGAMLSDYARSTVLAAGYRSCDQTILDDFQREAEKLVAPGVLCPPISPGGEPYLPPDEYGSLQVPALTRSDPAFALLFSSNYLSEPYHECPRCEC